MIDTVRLVFGRDGRISLQFLLIGAGVSVLVIGLKFVGYAVGGPEFLFSGPLAVALLLGVTAVLAAVHARRNGGVLVSISLAFLPMLADRASDLIFDIGHPQPNEGVLFGVWTALLFGIAVGIPAFVLGRQ